MEVEVHYRPSFLLCFWHNRRLQKYYERVKEEQFSHQVKLGEQKDGGASKPSPDSAGWDRQGVLQNELKELGLRKFAGAIMYIMYEVSHLIVSPNEKYGKFVLNEVLEAGNFGIFLTGLSCLWQGLPCFLVHQWVSVLRE